MTPEYQIDFDTFVAKLESRLQGGADEYGNKSFSSHPIVLLEEVEEELLDVCNWAFILYYRLKDIKATLGKL